MEEICDKNNMKPTLGQALIPIVFLIIALGYGIVVLEVDPHIPLLIGGAVAALVAMKIGYKWDTIEDGIFKGIMIAMQAIVILMIVGTLIGSWVEAGVVPSMIYYGLQILSPQIFLVATAIVCTIVSVFAGSSWTTAATIGIALLGVGEGLGVPAPITAGAIISGAYVGDKMSPLSDSTNLAAGTTGDVDLFDHIRHMLYVTIPAYIITLIIYAIIGLQFAGESLDEGHINVIIDALSGEFQIGPMMLIPVVFVLILIGFKIPPIPGLLLGSIVGALFAIIFQGAAPAEVIGSMHYGFVMDSGVEVVDDLLTIGGLDGMMWTISLILVALSLGGILERARFLEVFVENILKLTKTIGSLSLVTHITAVFFNIVTADQYLAIVLNARMYKNAY
ncbi:Na+/H+ antiporter NhaC [Natranaerobius thermophilus]|uniref:Na+/H+ antiporter NhaC n=1 Tax=Natranaerobius thermophilus TaxID=375929 RepID=UPI000166B397|nr:Na+/H+ antiporter NhaC [Natranaerobius thermophilus]